VIQGNVAIAPVEFSEAQIEVEYVPVKKLLIDKKYQRLLKIAKIRDLIQGWDIKQCDHLRVSRRIGAKGKLYIFDGQHRWEAARQRFGDDYLLPCRIEELTAEEEAGRFAEQHRHETKIPEKDRFYARLFANDPVAIEIHQIIESADWRLAGKTENATQSGVLHAFGALQLWHERLGPTNLRRALLAVRQAWPDNADASDGRTIEAMCRFIGLYADEIDDDRLIRKLGETTPRQIRQKSADLMTGRIVGMTRVILSRYNSGLQKQSNRVKDKDLKL
jgi:hypothetical protein